jgi:hypothetical protein
VHAPKRAPAVVLRRSVMKSRVKLKAWLFGRKKRASGEK